MEVTVKRTEARTMVNVAKSTEPWQTLVNLRSQREIVERWLASHMLTPGAEESLLAMLRDIDDQLQRLSEAAPTSHG